VSDHLAPEDSLSRAVAVWRAATPAPAVDLEERVLRAVRAAHAGTAPAEPAGDTIVRLPSRPPAGEPSWRWYRPGTWPAPAWAAAGALAALLVVGVLLVARGTIVAPGPARADRLLVAAALRDAEAAEREHARAIARLQELAAPVLARVRDPQLSPEHTGRLMVLAERLRFLDATIAEIDAFVAGNPGHPGARATLLAAYTEKTDVLRDIIALDEEIAP
jgi:hypothetical protein